jgi:hypothetical protein
MKQRSTILSSRAWSIALAITCFALALSPPAGLRADDGKDKFQVHPFVYDPADTDLVQSGWLSGIGCPTAANVATYPATKPTGTYTDPACATSDPKDKDVEGLLLAKTGPTSNNAAAGAQLKGLPKNLVLTELGYDLRKPGADQNDVRGSHCGAGAPRFNITTSAGFFFLGCNSPPPTTTTAGVGWMRLRWGGSSPLMAYLNGTTLTTVTGTVKSIDVIFDEGQDASGGPDQFGLAVLDNIDVNGVLVGRGPHDEGH